MNHFESVTHPRDFIVPNELERYGVESGVAGDLTYLQVELTDKCNLACASCPRAVTPSSKDILTVEAFEKLLEATPTIQQVSFVGSGEAFMLKTFADYVRACSSRNITSSVNTNGVLITKRLPDAVAAGLNKIAISVDAADESLIDIRSGLTREVLEQAMLDAVKIVANSDTQIAAAVTLGAANLNKLGETLRFINDCGIRHVTIESMHHWGDDKSLNAQSLFHQPVSETIEAIERALAVALDLDLQVEIFDFYRLADPRARGPMTCAWPWDATFVSCKGEVTPCCINLEATENNCMGQLAEQDLNSVWHNERYTDFRESMAAGEGWSFCEGCVYRMQFGGFLDA